MKSLPGLKSEHEDGSCYPESHRGAAWRCSDMLRESDVFHFHILACGLWGVGAVQGRLGCCHLPSSTPGFLAASSIGKVTICHFLLLSRPLS